MPTFPIQLPINDLAIYLKQRNANGRNECVLGNLPRRTKPINGTCK